MNRAVASPEFRPAVPDVSRLCSDVKVAVRRPNVGASVGESSTPLLKRMSILASRPDIASERFREEWCGRATTKSAVRGLAGTTYSVCA